MASLNKVMLIGNLTRDVELTYLSNQTACANFGMAINRTWMKDGQKMEEVTFVDCTCFGKVADILAKYKKKGDAIFVEGRLKLDQWEAQDGSKRSKLKVIVDSVQFIGSKPQGDAGEYQGEPQSPAPRPQAKPSGRPQPMSPPRLEAPVDEPPTIGNDDIPF
jgi:single-strand DNA-binding protein